MTQRIKIQNLLLLAAFFFMIACQPQASEQDENAKVDPPAMNIHQAAFMSDVKAIQQHIKAGSDLNVKDEYGSTALNIATTFDKTAVALLLIKAGADLEVKSGDGSTVLHTASFFGRTEIVKALLEAGADIEAKNNFGSTPLASIEVPFDQVKPIYDQMSKDLGPLGFRLDYKKLEAARPVVADMIRSYQ